jgi:hypothetical protein
VAALCVVVSVVALGAGASPAVTNPGNVGVAMNLSVLTLGQNELGIRTLSEARADVDANGTLSIPAPNITFAPITLSVDLGDPTPTPVVVDTVALTDFRGHVDPRTGHADIVGAVEQRWSATGKLTDCPVGPFVIEAATDALGARAYSEATGNALAVDDGLVVNAVAPQTAGCNGHETTINTVLRLPIGATTTTTTVPTTTSTTSTTTIPASTTTTTASPTAPAVAAGSAIATPPPVPSVVLSFTISPPPSSHGHPAPPPTTAHKAPTAQHGPPKGGAAAAEEARHIARERARLQAERDRAAKDAKNSKKKHGRSTPTTNATTGLRAGGRYYQLPADLPGYTPMGTPLPQHKKGTASPLHAFPVSAIRATASGWMLIVPFLVLMAMAAAGVLLIKNEVVRTRPRHRLRLPPITKPRDDE